MKWLLPLLLLWPALALAAAQPYVPQPGDLTGKDQPNPSTVRQVRSRSEAYRGTPLHNNLSPANRTGQNRFQPRPYVPRAGDLPDGRETVPVPAAAATMRPEPTPPPRSTAETNSKPDPLVSSAPAQNGETENKAAAASVISQALAAYQAKDCPGLLKFFHTQAYVLVRNPWGEQGSLGHQQLREAHCADVSNPQAPQIQIKSSKLDIIAPNRAKAWGQLNAKIQHQGQLVDMPSSFEADLVKEDNIWLITDAIIQYDAP